MGGWERVVPTEDDYRVGLGGKKEIGLRIKI